MKKFIITECGVIVIGLLMVSSATAVPKVNSDPLMSILDDIEKYTKIIEENIFDKTLDLKTQGSINLIIKKIKAAISGITATLGIGDLIDLIIKIIQWLITFIQKLIEVLSMVFNLVQLVYTLVTLVMALIEIIIALIEFIKNLFNPEPLLTT